MDELLKGMYAEEEKAIIKSEVLHCIITHNSSVNPLTLEAAIVRVADALDLSEGRAKIPFAAGTRDAHAISSMAIKDVSISTSEEKPIVVSVVMGSHAGIFQIDKLLESKVKGSELEKHLRIEAIVDPDRDTLNVPRKMTFE